MFRRDTWILSFAIFEYKVYKVQVFCVHDAAWYAVLWHGSYFLTFSTETGIVAERSNCRMLSINRYFFGR